jgi:hypothetical protein
MEDDGDDATVQWLAEWAGCDGWGFGVLERVLGSSGSNSALSTHRHAQRERDEGRNAKPRSYTKKWKSLFRTQ